MSRPKGFSTAGVYRTSAGILVRRRGRDPGHVIFDPDQVEDIVRYMRARGLDGLEVNRSLCTVNSKDLVLLERFPFVRRLVIIHGQVRLDVMKRMGDLEELTINARCMSPLDFRCFPRLRVLRSYWVDGALTTFECHRLEELHLIDWPIPGIDAIRGLPRLRRLTVSGGSLRTFAVDIELMLEQLCLTHLRSLAAIPGLQRLVKLTQLELSHLPKLSALPSLERLSHLEVVKLEKVRGFKTLEQLGDLSRLRDLALVDMGEIKTLRFLARARHLAELWVIYNTRVRDGDLSFIDECRNLRLVKIDQTRAVQYVPSLDVIEKLVSSRNGATHK